MGCRDEETGHTPADVTGGGEDLCIGDLLSADGVGSLQEFHDDSELIPAEDRGGIVEGWIGAEIHVAWCGHHVTNPEVHVISISCVVKGFHGMKTTGSFSSRSKN